MLYEKALFLFTCRKINATKKCHILHACQKWQNNSNFSNYNAIRRIQPRKHPLNYESTWPNLAINPTREARYVKEKQSIDVPKIPTHNSPPHRQLWMFGNWNRPYPHLTGPHPEYSWGSRKSSIRVFRHSLLCCVCCYVWFHERGFWAFVCFRSEASQQRNTLGNSRIPVEPPNIVPHYLFSLLFFVRTGILDIRWLDKSIATVRLFPFFSHSNGGWKCFFEWILMICRWVNYNLVWCLFSLTSLVMIAEWYNADTVKPVNDR